MTQTQGKTVIKNDSEVMISEAQKTNDNLERIEDKFAQRTDELFNLYRQNSEISGKVLNFKKK